MQFYEWFVKKCAENNVTPTSVAKAIGVSAASASGWKSGSIPKTVVLFKIEQYFGERFEETENTEHPDNILEALKEEDGAFLHSYATMTEEQKNMMRIFAKGLKNGT